jgi:hypothetical protein
LQIKTPLEKTSARWHCTGGFKSRRLKVNILVGSVHTLKENVESLVVASKEIGLEVNADKTKFIVMS